MATIIVQENDTEVLSILTLVLREDGYKVYPSADCGEALLALVSRVHPEVVMLDYKLNGDSSISACKLIKKAHSSLPVIALSCNSNIDNLYQQHGFNDYIKKPFDLIELYQTLRKHLPDQKDQITKPA